MVKDGRDFIMVSFAQDVGKKDLPPQLMQLTESTIVGILKEHIYTLPLDVQCEISLTKIADDILLAAQPTFSQQIEIQAVGDAEFDGTVKVTPSHEKTLRGHLKIVFDAIKDGIPRTQRQLEEATGLTWAQINPRVRDLRKAKFGNYTINRQALKGGVHRYCLLFPHSDAIYY